MDVQMVSVSKFKARLSHYLAAAQAGQTIVITSRRKAIARVAGVQIPEGCPPRLVKAIASGAISWGGGKSEGASLHLSGGKSLSETVLEDRD